MNLEQKIKRVIAEQLGVKVEEVHNNLNFISDLGADSLDTVEMVMAFEEEFNTEISDDEAEGLLTVQNALDFITARVPEAA